MIKLKKTVMETIESAMKEPSAFNGKKIAEKSTKKFLEDLNKE